jgi:hypothetical protein
VSLTFEAGEHRAMIEELRRGSEAQPRPRAGRPRGRLPGRLVIGRLLIGLAAILVLGALAKPGMVVRLLPRTAEIYAAIGVPVNLRGLAFENVTARFEEAAGTRFLTVEGLLRNVARDKRELPRLHLVLADGEGRPVYSWTAGSAIKALAAGETAPFRARLAAPPQEAQAVIVDFAPDAHPPELPGRH